MMHTSFKLTDGTDTRYGFGLILRPIAGGQHVVLHGGDTTGFGTQDARFVEDGIDVIVPSNQEPAAYNAIMTAVYAAVAPPPPRPAPTTDAAVSPAPAASPTPDAYAKPAVDALARSWLDDAIAGTIDLSKLRASTRASLRLQRNGPRCVTSRASARAPTGSSTSTGARRRRRISTSCRPPRGRCSTCSRSTTTG